MKFLARNFLKGLFVVSSFFLSLQGTNSALARGGNDGGVETFEPRFNSRLPAGSRLWAYSMANYNYAWLCHPDRSYSCYLLEITSQFEATRDLGASSPTLSVRSLLEKEDGSLFINPTWAERYAGITSAGFYCWVYGPSNYYMGGMDFYPKNVIVPGEYGWVNGISLDIALAQEMAINSELEATLISTRTRNQGAHAAIIELKDKSNKIVTYNCSHTFGTQNISCARSN